MTKKNDKEKGVNRRDFLAGATAAGVAATALKTGETSAQESQLAAATPPNAHQVAMEGDLPTGYSEEQAG